MVEDHNLADTPQWTMPSSQFEADSETLLGFSDYWGMIRSRIWVLIVVPALFIGAAVFYLKSAVPVYEAEAQLLVETAEARLVRVEDVYDPTAGALSMDSFIATQIRLMLTHDMLAQACEDLDLMEWPGLFEEDQDPLITLLKNLSLIQERRTFLLRLGYRSPDPELVARFVNALADFYVHKFAEDSTNVSNRGLDRMRVQLRELAVAREEARQALIAYKETQGIVDIGTARDLLGDQMSEITGARVEAQLEESEQRSMYNTLSEWHSKADEDSLAAVANALPNTLITTFRTEIIRAHAQLPELLSRYGPSHAAVKTQKEIIENFEKALRREIVVNLRSAEMECARTTERRALLETEMEELEAKSLALDRLSGEYQVLEDTLKATENSYRMVLQRINEVELSVGAEKDQTKGGLSIREHARIPGIPVWPSLRIVLALACIGGFGCAMGINIVLCLTDNTAKNSEQVQTLTGFPYLGSLPPLREKETETSGIEHPLGHLAEAFRTVCISLRLSLSTRSHRCFLVTSADQGEGKTFAAFNLALSLARDGSKVLLLEGDMRRPRLREMVEKAVGDGVPGPVKVGLSSVLVGDATLEEARWVLPEESRLHLLFCGVVPPNPAELLSGQGFDQLLATVRSEYDMVIVDTPPVLHVADSCIIAGRGIPVIYVSRLFGTPVSEILHGARQLKMVSAAVAGVLVNEADIAKSGKRYGYYRYGGYRRYGYRTYGTYGQEGTDGKSTTPKES